MRRWRWIVWVAFVAVSSNAQDFDGLYRSLDNNATKLGGITLKLEYANDKLEGDLVLLGAFKSSGKVRGEYSGGMCFLRGDLGDYVAYATAHCGRERLSGTLSVARKGEKNATVVSFNVKARVSGLVQAPLPSSLDAAPPSAVSAPPIKERAAPPLEVYAAQCTSIFRPGETLAHCINAQDHVISDAELTGTDLRYLHIAQRCYPGLRASGVLAADLKRLALDCQARGQP